MDLKKLIREVPNWPIKGVNFKDITTLLQDARTFRYIVDAMASPFTDSNIDKVVAIDARGFILAGPIAYHLNCGVALVRKKGKLPYQTIQESYQKEYGPDTLTMHADSIKAGEKVLIVDDLLATGGTLKASIKMIEKLGGVIVGISLIIDLPYLGGSKKLNKYKISHLVSYDQE